MSESRRLHNEVLDILLNHLMVSPNVLGVAKPRKCLLMMTDLRMEATNLNMILIGATLFIEAVGANEDGVGFHAYIKCRKV